MEVIKKSFRDHNNGMVNGVFAVSPHDGVVIIANRDSKGSNVQLCIKDKVALAVNAASELLPVGELDENKRFFYAQAIDRFRVDGEERKVAYHLADVKPIKMKSGAVVWEDNDTNLKSVFREHFSQSMQDELKSEFEPMVIAANR